MPSTGIGVYGGSAVLAENDEISSTYEGRHLTFLASDITGTEHTLVTKGHPVVVGEHIVGVALKTEISGSDLIAIDTEGIWALKVLAEDDLGDIAVAAGDELWISKAGAIISKKRNTVTHTRFGYALGSIDAGSELVIAVKVHWDGDDELERIGTDGAPFISAEASRVFREYQYEARGGGIITGDLLSLVVSTVRAGVVRTAKRVLTLPGDEDRVGGYSTPMELELNIKGAGNAIQHTMAALKLAYFSESTLSINNFQCAFIQLADTTAVRFYMMPRFLHFIDEAAIPDAGVDLDRIFVDSDSDQVSNVRIRCGYGPNASPFWILCTDQPPT